jgi:NAD(P)-dependent dehydrogenase (short-subunit alcohol dehydrogenase family)
MANREHGDILGLRGARTLVVGGASGIGRATAVLLARCGANVVVADVEQDAARLVAEEVAAIGVTAEVAIGDATDEVQAIEMVATSTKVLGGLDGMVNIVGMAGWKTLFEMDEATWQLDLQRNLTQHFYVGRAVARAMIAQGTGGAMALVASVSGIYGAPNHGAYGAAKAGVMDLARTMSQEWAGYGIRVNAVAPDCIATPRVVATYAAQGLEPSQEAANKGVVPMARFGTPEEVAGPLVFLLSDLATFMTGQSLVVDGGTHAAFPHLAATTTFEGVEEG